MLALIGSVRLRWVETGADGADGGATSLIALFSHGPAQRLRPACCAAERVCVCWAIVRPTECRERTLHGMPHGSDVRSAPARLGHLLGSTRSRDGGRPRTSLPAIRRQLPLASSAALRARWLPITRPHQTDGRHCDADQQHDDAHAIRSEACVQQAAAIDRGQRLRGSSVHTPFPAQTSPTITSAIALSGILGEDHWRVPSAAGWPPRSTPLRRCRWPGSPSARNGRC